MDHTRLTCFCFLCCHENTRFYTTSNVILLVIILEQILAEIGRCLGNCYQQCVLLVLLSLSAHWKFNHFSFSLQLWILWVRFLICDVLCCGSSRKPKLRRKFNLITFLSPLCIRSLELIKIFIQFNVIGCSYPWFHSVLCPKILATREQRILYPVTRGSIEFMGMMGLPPKIL